MSVQWRERDWESLRRDLGTNAWIRCHLVQAGLLCFFLLRFDPYSGSLVGIHSTYVAARPLVFHGVGEDM
jgi:hypothetical protein